MSRLAPPARGLALLLALAAAVPRAAASDAGISVDFHEVRESRPSERGLLNRVGFAPSGEISGIQESDPISQPFDAVLIHGLCAGECGRIQISKKGPDGQWSPWQAPKVNRFPKGRFWLKGVFPAPAPGAVRLQILPSRGGKTGDLHIFSVEVFSSMDGEETRVYPPPSAQLPEPSPEAEHLKPLIHTRREWGAGDWKPADPNDPEGEPQPHVPTRITQHHTGGIYSDNLQDSLRDVRFIQDYHQNGRGWSDIGYHFLIDAAGNIIQGRPETVVGAHVKDQNIGNIGVAFLGNFGPPDNHRLTQAQRQAVIALAVWLRAQYGVDPITYLGHRDYNPATKCPGDNLYRQLPSLRDAFLAAAGPLRRAVVRAGEAALRLERAVLNFDGRRP